MLSPDLGTKRRCIECAAAFYDLNRDPITCPKCGAVHHPVARLRSDGRQPPRGRSFARRKPLPAVEPAAAEMPEPFEDDPDHVEADDTEEDQDEAGVEGHELAPDPDSPGAGDDEGR
jgi:uncharacterized protein (TIGR02300 family)